jgi:hypothetical protein
MLKVVTILRLLTVCLMRNKRRKKKKKRRLRRLSCLEQDAGPSTSFLDDGPASAIP